MVDPLMEGDYPVRGLYQALAIAAMCVQDQPGMRPVISDVVMALDHLASCNYDATHRDKQTNVIETTVDNEEKRVTESKVCMEEEKQEIKNKGRDFFRSLTGIKNHTSEKQMAPVSTEHNY